jgi:hypothetical protein
MSSHLAAGGPIPDGLRKCKYLQRLALHENQLSGELPPFNYSPQK